jgi:hypothetical protein
VALVLKSPFFNQNHMLQTEAEFKLPSLAEVDAFELPELLIPRMVKEFGYTEELANDLMREAKRMLYLYARTRESVVPSVIVDDAWHTFLLFTRSYKRFADFIGVYVHHEPTKGSPDGGVGYARTKTNYEREFGETPNPKYWP